MAEIPGIPENSDIIRYEVGKFHLVFPDGVEVIEPSHIQTMELTNRYGNHFLPLFNVELMVDTRVYFKMIENRYKLKINMDLKYYKYNPNGKPDLKRNFFSKRFITLLDTKQTNLLRNTFKESDELHTPNQKNKKEPEFTDPSNKRITVPLYLFEETSLNAIYSVSPNIYDGNMATIMTHLLESKGVSNLLMAPLDNKSSHSNVIIPPITLGAVFKYLSATYGFYKEGGYLYLGLLYSYMLPSRPGKTAWVPNEMNRTVLVVRESDDVFHFNDGSRMQFDERSSYLNVKPEHVIVKSDSALQYIVGTQVNAISTKNNSISSAKSKEGFSSVKYINNKLNNPFQASAYINNINGSNTVVSVMLLGINIRTIEPNKVFEIRFVDKQSQKILGGEYRLESSHITFRNNGDHMICDAILILKK